VCEKITFGMKITRVTLIDITNSLNDVVYRLCSRTCECIDTPNRFCYITHLPSTMIVSFKSCNTNLAEIVKEYDMSKLVSEIYPQDTILYTVTYAVVICDNCTVVFDAKHFRRTCKSIVYVHKGNNIVS
jgi:uncharacterized protein YqfB (UPF0267 family)